MAVSPTKDLEKELAGGAARASVISWAVTDLDTSKKHMGVGSTTNGASRRASRISYYRDTLLSPTSDYYDGVRRLTGLYDGQSGFLESPALSPARASRMSKYLEAVQDTGFEVKWDGPEDSKNPLNWSLWRKAIILLMVALQTLMVVFYSTSYISGTPGMMEEFNIRSRTKITFGMTTYMMGLATGPLLLAPMSELYGRRPVYLVSLFLFSIFVLAACLAENFVSILIVRFFAAFVGSVTLSNAPGSIGDIYNEEDRTLAFSFFSLAIMNGPVLGPIVGGFVFEALGWRWTNLIVLIMSLVFWVLGYFLVPETYQPLLLRKKAKELRKKHDDDRYLSRFCDKDGGDFWGLVKTSMKRPLLMLFTEPLCIFWAVYIAMIYGILYLSFIAYPIVFSEIRGWGPGISGLPFCGIGIGTVLAVALDPVNLYIYNLHEIDPETGKRPPEARIAIICLAAVLSPAAMLWFAWTCVPVRIPWIWPVLSGVPYGLGNTLIFLHGNNYLVTSYDVFAASASAGNTVARSIVGGALPLIGPKMYASLGPNMAATTVAIIAISLIPIPWGFYNWGHKVRMHSPMLLRLQKEKLERGE